MNKSEKKYEDFIATVSHELRTPLTSIRGFSQTMLTSWDKLDDNSKKKFVKIIEEQSERLINLVENMLAVTKLQSTKNLLVYNEIDSILIINQIIAMLKNQYPEHVFKINSSGNIPKIFADSDKFQQIMTNLLENSAKYSVDDNNTEITIYQGSDEVILKISNIGINIEKSDYEKIFKQFSRIDNPLTRKVQGSGLGLYITKNLTEKMGGSLSVESFPIEKSLNKGKIVFTLKMPVKNIEEQARIKCNR